MRVLMFGWEFPPHISGGLGTASYGLTKGMAAIDNLEVIFVVPKVWGDEDQNAVRLIGANKIPVAFKQIFYEGTKKSFEKIEIFSRIVPYTDPDDFWKVIKSEVDSYRLIVHTNSKGMVDFSKGRIKEVLDAIEILKEDGEDVILKVSGPIAVLNILTEPKNIFKTMRRNPELMDKVYEKVHRNIKAYISQRFFD